MRLRMADAGTGLVAFCVSPAYEVLRSLHVLGGVRHHPLHISWTLRARSRMSTALRDEVNGFAFWYLHRPLVFGDIWPPTEVSSWADELSALRNAPVEHFAEPLIHGALARRGRGPRVALAAFRDDVDLREQAFARVGLEHPESLPAVRELVSDPEGCRRRFADLLSAYWDTCIAPDWSALAARLRADVDRRGRAMSRRGPVAMMTELSPYISAGAGTGEVVIRPRRPSGRADPIEVTLGERDRVLLVPSHFVWPELVAVLHNDMAGGSHRRSVLVTYALDEMQRQGQPPVPPADLLKMLRAAGDPTRLQILALLARRPCSTSELAGLIGLTEAAISKHVKLLLDAGWVEPERRSYYVYYRLLRDSHGRLSRALDELLG